MYQVQKLSVKQRRTVKILLVEDNEGDAYFIQESLHENYCPDCIQITASLKDAITCLEQSRYDVILLDLSLPDSENNSNTIEKMVSHAPGLPIIILTGYSDQNFAINSLKLGVQEYLLKDEINATVLLKSIDYSIERNRISLSVSALQNEREKEISDAVIRALDKNKQEIGNELHDNVNQILTGARMFLYTANKRTNGTDENLINADEMLMKAIVEIRKLSHSLQPPSLDAESLDDVLNNLTAITEKASGLKIVNQWHFEDIENLPQKVSLNIYRIVQEQLTNIIKHAYAKNVVISLNRDNNDLSLLIKDDGIGFDVSKKGNGVGFTNIKTRAKLFNGMMEIDSAPAEGCILHVQLNLS